MNKTTIAKSISGELFYVFNVTKVNFEIKLNNYG